MRYTSFNHGIVIGYSWHYLESVAQETYLPYTHQWGGTEGQYDYVFSGYDLVLNHISVSYAQKALEYYINWLLIVEGDFLLAAPLYDIFSDELKKWQEEEKIKIIGESDRETKIEYVTEWEEIVTISFKKLNVSYLFNYEGEPNAGYFFARGFEAGGKIENTPYEPKREGYSIRSRSVSTPGILTKTNCRKRNKTKRAMRNSSKRNYMPNGFRRKKGDCRAKPCGSPAAKRRIGFD